MGCCLSSSKQEIKKDINSSNLSRAQPQKQDESPHSNLDSYTSTRKKFVEDVTDEELVEEKKTKFEPGPGELWMEPVDI